MFFYRLKNLKFVFRVLATKDLEDNKLILIVVPEEEFNFVRDYRPGRLFSKNITDIIRDLKCELSNK